MGLSVLTQRSASSDLSRLGLFVFRQFLVREELCDLHRIERGAFAEVIRDTPEIQRVVLRAVFANAGDISRVIADTFNGRDIAAVFWLIDNHNARAFAQEIAGIICGEFIFEFHIDALGMANEGRDADTSRGDFDGWVEDFHCLGLHFPLFFGVAAVHEDIDMRFSRGHAAA